MEDNGIGPLVGVAAGILFTVSAGLIVNSLFPDAFQDLMEIEGGYVNHEFDRGGATNWGITEATARACGYEGDMREMPMELAVTCAWEHYWEPLGLDRLATREDTAYKELAIKLFEIGYHAGPSRAGWHLQQCLNDFNQGEKVYADVTTDGKIGDRTIRAFESYRDYRGDAGHAPLLGCVKTDYCAFLLRLVRRDETQEAFAYGWIRARCI